MKTANLLLVLIVIAGLAGCEKAADVASPELYEKHGVSFSYPGNWKITEDAQQGSVRQIIVESPGDAIVIALIYPAADAVSLNEFAERFASHVQQEASIITMDKATFSSSPEANTRIRERFNVSLLGVKVPHVREYNRAEGGDTVAFLVSQAAEEDLAKVKPGFELIVDTFKLLTSN
ncbi:hypothetical protein CAI21_09375 [Alkalilimnicola ehrlichii]|uniref:Lipoprotein n=1 Tax=Alkalilimnicola ehrlichii TaxID=351052 RepID=A0A3E0WXB3_9GAMM|nr:hypothetical protein [Alkalilimnicola ehrlichii]RFA29286.1 hypothetical protein CAI21_09375 [Alkalilimnicola ehrlichii]RFA36801.1 hypothetical protein CAL65_09715 [Alkalilimnicola ehrlichii]